MSKTIRGLRLTEAQAKALFPGLETEEKKLIETVTATPTTLSTEHQTVLVNATAGAKTVALPTAASAYDDGVGRVYTVKKTDVSVNAVTVDGSGAETIDGAATFVLSAQYASVSVQSNGTAWFVIGSHTPA